MSLQHRLTPSLRYSRRGQQLLLIVFSVFVAARCGSDSINSPTSYGDPANAALSPGESLAITRWNGATQGLIAKNRPSQNAAWRIFAYVTLAQHVALERIASDPGVTRAKMRGAVAGASQPVLAHLFPNDVATIDSLLLADEASIPPGQREAFRSAATIGRTIGATIAARAQGDRFNATWTGTVPTGPGKWSSLANPPAPPLLPLLGEARPIFMSSGSQFRAPPPPDFNSNGFRESLAEVARIASSRTPTQDSIAKFWALGTGSLIAGYWNITTLDLITRERFGERAAAHALALMNTAGLDANIACHDSKFTYWLIRPSGADPSIKLSISVPNHPSYPSNHACTSGVAGYVLGTLFPMDRERLDALANEASISRLYAGIHYRFDMDAGLELARKLAALAIEVDRRGGLLRIAP